MILTRFLKLCLSYGGILLLGGLGGCTLQPPPEPDVFKHNGQLKPTQRPYVINGRDYYPQDHYEYDQVGIASWYGPGFHGKKTSTGAYFDTNKLTAAHNTLPLPCIVRVTNLENGRVIEVEVNDRGPFAGDRIIDLSRRAAQMLGFINKGLAQVRVECLPEESRKLNHMRRHQKSLPAKPSKTLKKQSDLVPSLEKGKQIQGAGKKKKESSPKKGKIHGTLDPHFHLSTPAFSGKSLSSKPLMIEIARCKTSREVEKKTKKLLKVGMPRVTRVKTGSKSFYRMTLGPFKTVKEAQTMVKKIISLGETGAHIQK